MYLRLERLDKKFEATEAVRELSLDIERGEMLSLCGLRKEQMAKVYESYEAVGTLTPESAQRLGLPRTVTVAAGAGE